MKMLGSHATEQQKTKLQQRTNALMRCIEAWVSVQVLYMLQFVSSHMVSSYFLSFVALMSSLECVLMIGYIA